MNVIRVSTPQDEGVLQVSKSLKYQVLLDDEEMKALLAALPPFFIGVVSEVIALENGIVSLSDFLDGYQQYITPLKRGELPVEAPLRRYFSSAFSANLDAFYAMDLGKGRFLLKTIQPVIQLQVHHFFHSPVDQKFHPMVLGKESVTWGIQFSYPQIAQDPKTCAIQKVDPASPNSLLFQTLGRWMREHTRPTPFMVGETRSNEPIRIGKECFNWIGRHPQLMQKGIHIRGSHAD